MDHRVREVGVTDEAFGGRPAWVRRRGERRPVIAVEGEWRQTDRRLFRVRLADGERLLLVQRDDGRWSVTPAAPPLAPPVA